MYQPELVFVVGPNAAGKSSFIRTRLNELDGCEIIMTDVYKWRAKSFFLEALGLKRDIVMETVFNDPSFKDLVDRARDAGYHTSLVVLFLDTVQQSVERVAFRSVEQTGLHISGDNVKINFNESFKNVAQYFFYFHQSEFIYTGETGINKPIMSFKGSSLTAYNATELQYPQKFAHYSFTHGRLSGEAFNIIQANKDFKHIEQHQPTTAKQQTRRFKL